jgi:prepilin peptidase CpaA
MMMTFSLLLPMVSLLGMAVFTDLRTRRIPNLLSVGGFILALSLRFGLEGISFFDGLLASGAALAFALPFFLMGGLGGGDVKLMAMVGAFLGLDRLPMAALLMGGVGAGMAIVAILRRGQVRGVATNLFNFFATFGRGSFTGWKGTEGEAVLHLETPGAITLPYAVAIAAGGVGGWFL